MKQFIYADNAATTQLNKETFEAMVPWLLDEYGNASQPYAFARKPKKALSDARQTIAKCINALPEEVFFTSGGTESDNWAIKGSAFADPNKRATITSAFEHHAVLHSCEAIERLGYPVAYLMPNTDGVITSEALNGMISNTAHLVSIMFANNEIGTIQPIKKLCDVAHSNGALFHTDAVQAVGHVEIDVQKLGVDMLSASAHKFNGPKGIGFLYIRKGAKISPYADGGAQEYGLRAGTENIASIVGMASALQKNCSTIETNAVYLKILDDLLIKTLDVSGIDYQRNGNLNRLPGIISLSFKNADGEALLHRLDLMGICVSTGSACDNVNTKVSHVLRAIQLDESYAKGTIRISLSKDNTTDEINKIAQSLLKILKS
ncbi:MAG: cysteine desulfurase family protein [Eubacteriales bacterium]